MSRGTHLFPLLFLLLSLVSEQWPMWILWLKETKKVNKKKKLDNTLQHATKCFQIGVLIAKKKQKNKNKNKNKCSTSTFSPWKSLTIRLFGSKSSTVTHFDDRLISCACNHRARNSYSRMSPGKPFVFLSFSFFNKGKRQKFWAKFLFRFQTLF